MCTFITAAVPRETDLDRLESLVSNEIRRTLNVGPFTEAFAPLIGPSVRASDVLFRPTHGMCDCGTVLGEAAQRESGVLRTVEQRRRKYEKLGWSPSRIARAVGAFEHHRTHQCIESKGREAELWREFLRTSLESGVARRLCLLHHFYDDDHPVGVIRRESHRITEVSADDLRHLDADVLHCFHL